MNNRRPKTVKVCVYSSRNLKSKKDGSDPLAWVVFGFGKQKCCTSQIRERNPKWNEESTFTINDTKTPLKINVKDKDDILGQIIIPLDEIPSEEHFLKWVSLGAHKKNSNPHGEVCIDCWVEDYYQDVEEVPVNSSSSSKPGKFLRKNLNRLTGNKSPDSQRKLSSDFGTSIKGSHSMEDISSKGRRGSSPLLFGKSKKDSLLAPPAYTNMRKSLSTLALNNGNSSSPPSTRTSAPPEKPTNTSPTLSPVPQPSSRRNSSNIGDLSQGLPTIKEQCFPPKIQNIVPISGPSTGGTLIQITGKYLGNSKEDITRLMVAGCNCIDSIEYYTSNKIMCTTSESLGIGPITMSTRSGGMSSSKMMFEFVESKEYQTTDRDATDSGRSSGASDNNLTDKEELIQLLKTEIEELKHDNKELREYIDKLVVYLMDKYPSALESSKMY